MYPLSIDMNLYIPKKKKPMEMHDHLHFRPTGLSHKVTAHKSSNLSIMSGQFHSHSVGQAIQKLVSSSKVSELAFVDFCIVERAINLANLVVLQPIKPILQLARNALFLLCPLVCQNCTKLSTTAVSNCIAAILLQSLLHTQSCVLSCNSQQLYVQRSSSALTAQPRKLVRKVINMAESTVFQNSKKPISRLH